VALFGQMGLRMSSEVTRRDVTLAGELRAQLPCETAEQNEER